MGIVHTDITLTNLKDNNLASGGYIKPEEIRTETVTAVADTGAMYLVITEELRQKLGLEIKEERTAHIANGQLVTSQITEAVEVHWKDRKTTVQAMIIPGAKKILFGALPMEAMDLMVNPVTQEVVGVHGDNVEFLALHYYFDN